MKLYSLELVLYGWLAYNIFVEIHDWVADSFEDNEQHSEVVAPEPVLPPAIAKPEVADAILIYGNCMVGI